jgi:hypothetical protein
MHINLHNEGAPAKPFPTTTTGTHTTVVANSVRSRLFSERKHILLRYVPISLEVAMVLLLVSMCACVAKVGGSVKQLYV